MEGKNKIVGWTEPFVITLCEAVNEDEMEQKGNFKFEAYVTRWDKNKEGWSVRSRNGVRYNRNATVKAFQDAIDNNNGIPVMYNHITEGAESIVLGRIFKLRDEEEGLIVEGYLDGKEPLVENKIAKGLLSNISLQVAADEDKSKKISENNDETYYAFPIETYEVSFVPVNGIYGGNLLSTVLMENLNIVKPGKLTSDDSKTQKSNPEIPPKDNNENILFLNDEEISILKDLMYQQDVLKNNLNGKDLYLRNRLYNKATTSQINKILGELKKENPEKPKKEGEVKIENYLNIGEQAELFHLILEEEFSNVKNIEKKNFLEQCSNEKQLNQLYNNMLKFIETSEGKKYIKEQFYTKEFMTENDKNRLRYLQIKSEFTPLTEKEQEEIIGMERELQANGKIASFYADLNKIYKQIGLDLKNVEETMNLTTAGGAIGPSKLNDNIKTTK